LVQRAIQSPLHCFDRGLTLPELEESFEDLVAWVERGELPDGEDLSGDVPDAGAKFTRKPRAGSSAAAMVSGADQRLAVNGTITLNGVPVSDGFLWADVVTEGRRRACSYTNAFFDQGRYRLLIAPEAETAECGAPGSSLLMVFFDEGQRYEGEPVPWPDANTPLTLDLAFTADDVVANSSIGSAFSGELLGTAEELPAGTTIEAYIGDVLCGFSSIPPVQLVFDDGAGYDITVMSPTAIPACTEGATISFRVGGELIKETAIHDLGGHFLDLRAP
jgi:hypothetical protein